MLERIFKNCIEELNNIGYFPDAKGVRLNNRLSRAYARYLPNEKIIEVNQKVFNNISEEQLKSLLIHELSHNLDHIINGEISNELKGHGEAWQKIAKDISEKLGITIQRHADFVAKQEYADKFYHTYKCRICGMHKTVQSKFEDGCNVRAAKCEYCKKPMEYLFAGQYGTDIRTMKRIIIPNKRRSNEKNNSSNHKNNS